jgi:hypothetical protein
LSSQLLVSYLQSLKFLVLMLDVQIYHWHTKLYKVFVRRSLVNVNCLSIFYHIYHHINRLCLIFFEA